MGPVIITLDIIAVDPNDMKISEFICFSLSWSPSLFPRTLTTMIPNLYMKP